MPSPLFDAKRANYPRATCVTCFRPMRYANPQICDGCYGEMSKAGQLLERKESCQTPNSK